MTLFGWSEPMARFAAFAAIFFVMALWELLAPRRGMVLGRSRRWFTNLSFVGLGAATVRALAALASITALPLVALAAAFLAEARGWGLLTMLGLPDAVRLVVALVVLDFAIWLQHLAAHRIPALWMFHRMHHADRDFDVTTALRFHPVEIGLSMLWKVLWVLVLGAPPIAVLLFEIILNGCAMFNHANVKLPDGLDRVLRLVVVTPDMHRVHHSIRPDEHHRNFGFNLSIWDRMFGTFVAQPADGHTSMTIGLPTYQTPEPGELFWSLKLPFRGDGQGR
jgi:sterol desaturase/sphingolipid hydroxylase (fatty acid hydroxylase superfamily)